MAEFALLLIGYHILGLVILGQMGGGCGQSLVHFCPLLFLSIFCFPLFRGLGRVFDGEEEEGLEGM
jgi:hypothetical protein